MGVILGAGLVYRSMEGWLGQREASEDRVLRRGVSQAQFTAFVKSAHRVLLTRVLRGCYLYFVDAQTRDFVLARTEPRRSVARAAESQIEYETSHPTEVDR